MRKKKLLAMFLSVALAAQPVVCAAAEMGDSGSLVEDTVEQEENGTGSEAEQENVDDTETETESETDAVEQDLDSAETVEAVDDGEIAEQNLPENAGIPSVQTATYAHSAQSETVNGVTLKVEWNEPVLGEETTFHVSATGGSGKYKFMMEAPSYASLNEYFRESVADPSNSRVWKYTENCGSHDYTFEMTASGKYYYRFYIMDLEKGVTGLKVDIDIQVSNENYPSVNSIVASAVAKCKEETDGSDYAKALWLHDWLLEQLEYDNSLKWSSAESALTRHLGTCQAYESAYAKLLTAAGIENAETRDTADGHTWNAMKLDGEWYQVDCTWDDSDKKYNTLEQRHLYFGLTDELMTLAHKGHQGIYTADGYATRSTSLANNYFVKSGEAKEWAESYAARIQEKLDAGETNFTIAADNATDPPSISGIQNGIIAYALNQMQWSANGENVTLQATGGATEFTFTATPNGSITGEKSKFYTLNLDGTIAINLYMELPESLVSNQNAYMEFSLPNGSTSQVKVKDAVQKDGYYVFTCRVAAKEMAADVKARMVADGQHGKEYTVSVQRYAKYVLENPDDYSKTTVDLVKAMLNYGAAAQKLFNYQTNQLANNILNAEEQKVSPADFSAYKHVLTTDPNEKGISCYVGSLCLESDTSIKDYFVLSDGANIDTYAFYGIINNSTPVKLEPQKTTLNGKECYAVEIKNIKAQNLDQSVVVTVRRKDKPDVNVITLQFNAFSYAYVMAHMTPPDQKAVDVTNAMYTYWQLAKQYVDEKAQQ